jgi:tetratricopeptide (TPR) repeat protein
MIIDARVKTLKEKIRKEIVNILSREMMAHQLLSHIQQSGNSGQLRQFISRLQKLIELDPDVGMFYFLLGVTLLESGEIKPALDVVTAGIESSTKGEIDKLSHLHEHLEKMYLQEALKPAVLHFKQQQFDKARRKLSELEAVYRKNKLVVLFDTYLLKLAPLRKSIRSKGPPAPSGKAEDVEELYNLLVEDEVNEAFRLLDKGQFDNAESLLRRARSFAPAFPFVNHMLANCIYMYNRLSYLFAKEIPDKETLVEKLKEAKTFAQVGRRSVRLKNDLVDAIDHFIKRLEEENKADRVIQEFVKTMDSAHGEIGDISQFNKIQRRMQSLECDIAHVKSAVSSDDIRSTMDQLAEIVDNHLFQLEKIEDDIKDAEVVKELFSEFNKIIESTNRVISSVSQIDSNQSILNTLLRKIDTAESKVSGADAEDALARLKKNVDDNLKQLDSIREDIIDKEIVSPLVSNFNTITKNIQSNPISSLEELNSYRDIFKALKKNVESARRQVRKANSKNTLDDLSAAINDILSKLGD